MIAHSPPLKQASDTPTLYPVLRTPPMVLDPQSVADTFSSLHSTLWTVQETVNTNASQQSQFNTNIVQDTQSLSINIQLLRERVKQVEELASFAGLFAEFVKNYHPTVANDFAAFIKVKERVVPAAETTQGPSASSS